MDNLNNLKKNINEITCLQEALNRMPEKFNENLHLQRSLCKGAT